MLVLPSTFPISSQNQPSFSTNTIFDDKGIQVGDLNATNSLEWNNYLVMVGEIATYVFEKDGDNLSLLESIPIKREENLHRFAYYNTTDFLAIISHHKLIFFKTLESQFIKKEFDEQQVPIPVSFISKIGFEYVVVDLAQTFVSMDITTKPLSYAIFFESQNLNIARLHPEKLYFDAVAISKNNPSNALDNEASVSLTNFSSMESSELVKALSLQSIADIAQFYFELISSGEGDANDEWGFMKDFTETEEKQISMVFLQKHNSGFAINLANLFAGQLQDKKEFVIAEDSGKPVMFRHFDYFTKSNFYALGLNETLVVCNDKSIFEIKPDSPLSFKDVEYAYLSPNLTFLILMSKSGVSSVEFRSLFKSESDISSRLKLAIETGYWLDMIRFIYYPINNYKQHALIPNRIFDTFKAISSYYSFKTLVSTTLSPIQRECLSLLLVTTRDFPPLKLSFMNVSFIMHAIGMMEFFYGCVGDLPLLIPTLTELLYMADDGAIVSFDEDAIDFLAPQIPFFLDFLLYVIRDLNLFIVDKQKFESTANHVLFFVHPALVKLILQILVCIRSVQLFFKTRPESKYKFLDILIHRTKLNLKEIFDIFKEQKEKLENGNFN
eukprot:NODE_60_length_27201_cov_1.043318.p3 type:complete len:611 gc:universal NODE_60_length_27201_cov_1.043318:6465-8297(+)